MKNVGCMFCKWAVKEEYTTLDALSDAFKKGISLPICGIGSIHPLFSSTFRDHRGIKRDITNPNYIIIRKIFEQVCPEEYEVTDDKTLMTQCTLNQEFVCPIFYPRYEKLSKAYMDNLIDDLKLEFVL